MEKIKIEKPTEEKLKTMGVESRPIWEKEPSVFSRHYDDKETCYLLAGKARVKTGEEEVEFGAGDMVVFPKGMDCEWSVIEPLKKYYKFG